jgi:hypothetical protein
VPGHIRDKLEKKQIRILASSGLFSVSPIVHASSRSTLTAAENKIWHITSTLKYVDTWIKIDQLDVACFIISLFTAQHVSNVVTSIFRSLRLIVDLFHVLYCSGSMCIGVTVWFGWGGVVSLCRLKHCLHKDTTPPQPNHTVTPTHIEPEQYSTWNKSTISRKLLKMDVTTFETCWAVNSEIIKQVTSSWSIFVH